MDDIRSWWRRPARWLTGLAAPGLLVLGEQTAAQAADPLPTVPALTVAAPAPLVADLATLRKLALEQQPALTAYRASVAAAHERLYGLEQLRFAAVIRRDLPTRRQQAEQGILAAEARLHQAENQTLYAVTRNYWTAVYAQVQGQLATDVLDKLRVLKTEGEKLRTDLGEERREEIPAWTLEQVGELENMVTARREEALKGRERALAALREAVGVAPSCCLQLLAPSELPTVPLSLCCADLVNQALARRAEILLATVGVEVTALEITAQSQTLFPRSPTFASGTDLHAEPLPQGIADGDYRPAAIGLEMPANMVGCKGTRVEQARALNSRACSVLEKTQGLIRLEAEDAFFRWKEATDKLPPLEKAIEEAERIAERAREGFKNRVANPKLTTSFSDVLNTRQRATQLRVLLNQTRFQLVLALADLERVTAGGFCPPYALNSATLRSDTPVVRP